MMKKLNLKNYVIIILLVCNNVFVVFSQDSILEKKMTLSLSDVTIQKALNEISKKSSIDFSYNSKMFEDMERVSIDVKDRALKVILNKMLFDKSLDFKVVNNQVIILKPSMDKSDSQIEEVNQYQEDNNDEEEMEENSSSEGGVETGNDIMLSALSEMPFSSPEITADENSAENDELDEEYDEVPFVQEDSEVFQVSFVYPLGTHGIQSKDKTFDVSFNVLGGNVAGVDAFELAGLYNIDNNDVNGVQIGGLANIVGNDVTAVQIGGLSNVNGGSVNGVQIGGLANIVGNDIDAIQIGGLSNINGGNVNGLQVSGLANISEGKVDGCQITGLANIVDESCKGVQISGLANVVGKEVKGFQITGLANVAGDNVSAGQISGIVNISGDIKGLQITGIINISKGDIDGVQISGIANIAKKVKGLQLGVVNICDSVESGIPFGVVSIVNKNGFTQFDISSNEALNVIASYRMGIRSFYNSYALGVGFFGNSFRWAIGFGFGTRFDVGPKLTSDIELIAYSINEDEIWTNKLNLLNQLKYTFSTSSIIKNCELYAGPTFNVMVSEFFDIAKNSYGSEIAPWTTYDKTFRMTNVKMWPGISAGIRF